MKSPSKQRVLGDILGDRDEATLTDENGDKYKIKRDGHWTYIYRLIEDL